MFGAGMEGMMKAAIELLLSKVDITPEQAKAHIANVLQIVSDARAAFDRIERNQHVIMKHLGLEVGEHEQQRIQDGSSAAGRDAGNATNAGSQ